MIHLPLAGRTALGLLMLLGVLLLPLRAPAGGESVTLYFFWSQGCPHCLQEKVFLAELAQQDPRLKVVSIDITTRAEHRELLRKVGRALRVAVPGLPFTVVGNLYVVGWMGEETSGARIRQAIGQAREQRLPDVTAPLLPSTREAPPTPAPAVADKITLPLMGELELRQFSLLALTIILGALDGFNPCAMWALVFLIGLLLGLEERWKMWFYGGMFILASGLVYFLFMAAWLNFFLFLGLVFWVRLLIGLVALGAGVLNFRAFIRDRTGACKLVGGERRQRLLDRIKAAVLQQSFWLALGGIFLLGLAVNFIELFCSMGLPVIYTQILTLSQLPLWQYYLYLVFYIFFFMLDDMVIFMIAMLTLTHLGLTDKYKRVSDLVGGIVLVVVGLLLIFKPETLTFQ